MKDGQYVSLFLLWNIYWALICIQFENSLRRHNHVGLVHALVAAMAKAGTLDGAREKAKTVMKGRIQRAKDRGESMDED